MGQDSLCLSQEELRYITGYTQQKFVCEYLARRGIYFDISGSNEVIVLRELVKNFLSGAQTDAATGPHGGGSSA